MRSMWNAKPRGKMLKCKDESKMMKLDLSTCKIVMNNNNTMCSKKLTKVNI